MNNDESVKTSRRTVLRAGAAVLSAGAVARTALAQEKIAPEMVMYQDQPKDGQECDQCLHFEPPNACKLVAGEISPKGWCGVFAPKS